MPLADRPLFFAALLPQLLELRARTARPHWIIVDEAHHLLPSAWVPAQATVPQELTGLILITVHPDSVAKAILVSLATVVAVGNGARNTLASFAHAIGATAPDLDWNDQEPGRAAVWQRSEPATPVVAIKVEPTRLERRRHFRKYVEGELGEERSFYFRGPRQALNLRARNLLTYIQLADGVDDETWTYHLRRGEYSDWIGKQIKDQALATELEQIEQDSTLDARSSREQIKAAITRRYTSAA
jgi:hypothetical protein